MNHAERQRIKDYVRIRRAVWALNLGWRATVQAMGAAGRDEYFRMNKKHYKNWHIILRKIEKELDDERGR